MKIVRVAMWGLVAAINIFNVIIHIRDTRKAGTRWFDSETCAWMIGIFASLNSAFLNFMLD